MQLLGWTPETGGTSAPAAEPYHLCHLLHPWDSGGTSSKGVAAPICSHRDSSVTFLLHLEQKLGAGELLSPVLCLG